MAPFSDGTPQASQWPIPPGRFFDYEIFTENEDSGTYFYHSHVGLEAITCSGPLIIDDCGDAPYEYDDERIFHFQDYFVEEDNTMIKDMTGSTFKWMGETDGIILNGKGVGRGKTSAPGAPGGVRGLFGSGYSSPSGHVVARQLHARDTLGDPDQQEAAACSLPIIDVDPGKTYRFRFIGATGLSFIAVGFEGHGNLTIIQVDGAEYNLPVESDHIRIGAGQRYDVLFQSKTIDELAAEGDKSTYIIQFETRDRPDMYRGYGVLRYNVSVEIPVAPAEPVISLPDQVDGWMEYAFQPLDPDANEAPCTDEVTRRVVIDCDLVLDNATGRVMWELAHLAWTESTHKTPSLINIYQHGQDAIPDFDAAQNNYGWDPATMSFPARIGEVLEIVFQNRGAQVPGPLMVQSHPFHAHGKHFYDIGGGPGEYDAGAHNAKLEELDYVPVRRDTTMLFRYSDSAEASEAAGWRAWRIRVTDPGVWLIHCHIVGHMVMGMQSVWIVGNADDIIDVPRLASQGYMAYGGDVYGSANHAPNVYEYFNATTCKCGRVSDAYGAGHDSDDEDDDGDEWDVEDDGDD